MQRAPKPHIASHPKFESSWGYQAPVLILSRSPVSGSPGALTTFGYWAVRRLVVEPPLAFGVLGVTNR